MSMTKVPSSRLKARLGQYLRHVRAGKELVVTDRDVPVARLVPVDPAGYEDALPVWQLRDPAAPRLGDVKVRGIPYRGTDTTALLREERRRR